MYSDSTMKIIVLAVCILAGSLAETSAFTPLSFASPVVNDVRLDTARCATPQQGLSPPAFAQGGPSPDSPLAATDALAQSFPIRTTEEIWDTLDAITIEGGSIRTCNFEEEMVQRVEVFLKTQGRPLNADVELWQGPDNTPQRMQVYLEEGNMRPFRCTVETPGESNSVSVRNTGELEFPLAAGIEPSYSMQEGPARVLSAITPSRIVQGGAVYTNPISPRVSSIQVMLKTDGRPLNARIELMQGPNNNKQVMEVYAEDGDERPFYCILNTPGVGYVVRIVNTATVEFPLSAIIEPYMLEEAPPVEEDISWTHIDFPWLRKPEQLD